MKSPNFRRGKCDQPVVALAALDGVKPCLAYFGFRQKLAHADTVCRQHLCQHLAEAAVVRFILAFELCLSVLNKKWLPKVHFLLM